MIHILGRVEVHPTEDVNKVRSSVLSIFPDSDLTVEEDRIQFETKSVDRFLKISIDHQIRDTLVMVLSGDLSNDSTSFKLNKQAAYMGVLNLGDGNSTLGDIEIEVKEGANEFISMLTPGSREDNSVQHHLNTHPDNS